jgi:hypothetical protein
VPRLPLVPDPLRRVSVPRNLGGVTDVGVEDPIPVSKRPFEA